MNMALYLKTHKSQTLDPDGIPNLGGCSSKVSSNEEDSLCKFRCVLIHRCTSHR